jgi:gliding motility-associated-like protein
LKKKFYILLFTTYTFLGAIAQNQCPPNIDFELGNFNRWVCETGFSDVSLNPTGPVNNQHSIVGNLNTGVDFYGNFPISCPNGSGYSIRLGNDLSRLKDGGIGAQAVTYTYNIPASTVNFSVLYQYAIVLEDPITTPHTTVQKPRFQAIVKNITDNVEIGCVSFDFFAGGGLPGFLPSPNSPNSSTVYYKNWTPITLNLSQYAGKTIELKFVTSDCTLGGHFGYAYVDVNSVCNGAIIGTTLCKGDTSVNLTAPYGFQSYQWFSDVTYSKIISTEQVLTLNPAPNAGAVYPVVVSPFLGYGCADTLFANLTLTDKPISQAGPNAIACKYEQVPLGGPSNPNYKYVWEPANSVSNPSISNPTGFITEYADKDIVVNTIDLASGCNSFDTMLIKSKLVDTSLISIGNLQYCASDNITTIFKINSASSSIQWYNDNVKINSVNANIYAPKQTGLFWAQYIQNGCLDSTRQINFLVNPLPLVNYTLPKDTGCITSNSFTFNNTSSITNNSVLSYFWVFGDGTTSPGISPLKTYNSEGKFSTKLIASTTSGCKDSLSGSIYIMPNVKTSFTWDSACTNRPVQFLNLSKENNSKRVTYLWDFGDNTTSTAKQPSPFTYQASGILTAQLTATAVGCEADVQIVKKQVFVQRPKVGINYKPITVPVNYSLSIFARDSVGKTYFWQPNNQISGAYNRSTNFKAIDDEKYTITITDEHTCITIDTLQMYVLKKEGTYFPNSFTPNGDGLNDEILPYLVGMKMLNKFSIYNRSGNLIFSTQQFGQGWDGTYKGTPQNAGAYVWVLEFTNASNKIVQQKGSLLLIR